MTKEGQESARRTSAYIMLADEYVRAAWAVSRASIYNPSYWALIGHFLELALKADLQRISVGLLDEEDLMRVGHDLAYAFQAVFTKRREEVVPDGLAALVDALDRAHSMQSFRYSSCLSRPVEIDGVMAVATLDTYVCDVKGLLSDGAW